MSSTRDDYLPAETVLSAEIRRHRERLGLSQGELALRMKDAGVGYASQATVSRIEKMQRHVSAAELDVLASLFGLSQTELLRPTEADAYARSIQEYIGDLKATMRDAHAALELLSKRTQNMIDVVAELKAHTVELAEAGDEARRHASWFQENELAALEKAARRLLRGYSDDAEDWFLV